MTITTAKLADIEIRFNDDGSATIRERLQQGELEYNHNVASWTLTPEQVESVIYAGSAWDNARATSSSYEEWHEPRQ